MKKILLFVLASILVLSVAACGNSGAPKAEMPKQLIIATGGTSGTYYPLGGGIAQIITDATGVSASAQSTGASVENMRLLSDSQVDLAFTQTDIADYAKNGTEMFGGKKVENLQGLATLYYETIQIVLPANSTINSVAELKGKAVSVGAPGSGTELNAKQILEAYGLTFADLKAEHLSFGDSTQKIQDGSLDAAFVTAGAPTSAVTELSATKGVKLLSLDSDKIAELTKKYKFYAEQTIPANTYTNVGETKTVAVKAMLTVRKDLPEDLVYNITKALFANTEKLVTINAKAKQISIDTALEGMSLDIHPGAVKFYKEKGIIK